MFGSKKPQFVNGGTKDPFDLLRAVPSLNGHSDPLLDRLINISMGLVDAQAEFSIGIQLVQGIYKLTLFLDLICFF